MIVVTFEGGLVVRVSTDDPELKDRLNKAGGITVVDYDTEGADLDKIKWVKMKSKDGEPGFVTDALVHQEMVEDTEIERISS